MVMILMVTIWSVNIQIVSLCSANASINLENKIMLKPWNKSKWICMPMKWNYVSKLQIVNNLRERIEKFEVYQQGFQTYWFFYD